jgi:hypothetical protein
MVVHFYIVLDLRPTPNIVAALVMENRLGKKRDNEQLKLMNWLDGAGKSVSFAGCGYENISTYSELELIV